MKKFFALMLTLALVCSLGTVAFAGPSETVTPPVVVVTENVAKEGGWVICKTETDEVVCEVPDEDVTIVAVNDANTLEEADMEAFLAAYEAVKAIKDIPVQDFFWIDLADGYTVDADNYLKFRFTSEAEIVRVKVNGNEMAVVAEEEENSYFAKLTELGAVAIICGEDPVEVVEEAVEEVVEEPAEEVAEEVTEAVEAAEEAAA